MSTEEDLTGITAPQETRQKIEGLVERFARNLDVYTRPDYKETQVRVEFIDPLFEALGWDVRNVQGYAELYKDVVHEDAIKVSGATKAPDLRGDFYFVGSGGGGGGYGISIKTGFNMSYLYLLGVLNARLSSYYLKLTSTPFRGGYLALNRQYIERLRIRSIDSDQPADVRRRDCMVALVERMLDLHKKLAAATIPADKKLYQRQIEATDEEIDALAYELYGLTEKEIAIVKGSGFALR